MKPFFRLGQVWVAAEAMHLRSDRFVFTPRDDFERVKADQITDAQHLCPIPAGDCDSSFCKSWVQVANGPAWSSTPSSHRRSSEADFRLKIHDLKQHADYTTIGVACLARARM